MQELQGFSPSQRSFIVMHYVPPSAWSSSTIAGRNAPIHRHVFVGPAVPSRGSGDRRAAGNRDSGLAGCRYKPALIN